MIYYRTCVPIQAHKMYVLFYFIPIKEFCLSNLFKTTVSYPHFFKTTICSSHFDCKKYFFIYGTTRPSHCSSIPRSILIFFIKIYTKLIYTIIFYYTDCMVAQKREKKHFSVPYEKKMTAVRLLRYFKQCGKKYKRFPNHIIKWMLKKDENFAAVEVSLNIFVPTPSPPDNTSKLSRNRFKPLSLLICSIQL